MTLSLARTGALRGVTLGAGLLLTLGLGLEERSNALRGHGQLERPRDFHEHRRMNSRVDVSIQRVANRDTDWTWYQQRRPL
jgi:hypothetical protein